MSLLAEYCAALLEYKKAEAAWIARGRRNGKLYGRMDAAEAKLHNVYLSMTPELRRIAVKIA